MSEKYYPAIDDDVYDREHVIIYKDGSPHRRYGSHIEQIPVGKPSTSKSDDSYRTIHHVSTFPAGKTGADVVWARFYFNVSSVTGDPSTLTYWVRRSQTYNWHWEGDGFTECDYTCAQHTAVPWAATWGDFTTVDEATFTGPSTTGWMYVDVTALVKDALDSRDGDLNFGVGLEAYGTAGVGFYYWCKHSDSWYPYGPNRWYVEVEWVAPPPAAWPWQQEI